MGKVGKIAQRTKVVEKKHLCPECKSPATTPVLYVPPRGRSVNARACENCRAIWRISTSKIVHREWVPTLTGVR